MRRIVFSLSGLLIAAASAWAQTVVPPSIATNTTWGPSGNPYVVLEDTVVQPGVLLRVQPGALIQITNARSLMVSGRIEALGTAGTPIQFTCLPGEVYGGQLSVRGTSLSLEATGMLEYCQFTSLSNELEGAVFASNAYISVSNCIISNCVYDGFLALESRIQLIQNTICHVDEGMHAGSCAGAVISNSIGDITAMSDAIDMDSVWNGSGDPAMLIEWNHLYNGMNLGTDAIDYDGGTPTVRFNTISNFEDCGIIFGAGSQGDVYNNLVRNVRVCMAIDDGSTPVLMNNTFIDSGFGVRSRKRYFDSGGRGGMTNCIVWNCQTNIELDIYSQLSVGYCNMQGAAWPGVSNLSLDPSFINAAGADYHLGPNSPCIDRGLHLPAIEADGDLDKFPRQLDAAMDIGAYEFTRSITLMTPAATAEGAGILASAGRARFSVPQPTNVVIALLSSSTQDITLLPSITLTAGQTNATFDLTVMDDSVLDGGRAVSISGSAAGFRPGTGTITVADNELASLSLQVPSAVREGDSASTGTVRLSAVPLSSINVSLSANPAARVSIPATVTVAGGSTSATFSVSAVNNTLLDGAAMVDITASVPGWSSTSASVGVNDNESTNLFITLVPSVYEGDGLLAAAGSVRLGGVAVADTALTLLSSDPAEISVPATVTVSAGSTSATFSVTVSDDTLADGDKPVSVTASAAGFAPASANTVVLDNDVLRLGFSNISAVQTAGVPFAVALQVLTAGGGVMSNYTGLITLSASNTTGLLPLSPATINITAGGTWAGNISVMSVGTGIRLMGRDAAARTGSSNPFDTLSGTVHHLRVNNADSQRFAGRPFPIDVTACDVAGNPVPNYTGNAGLQAIALGASRTNTILATTTYGRTATGTRTAGVRFRITTNATVTHVRHIWGTKVSIWTDAGQLLVSRAVTSTAGQWVETALPTSILLTAGSTYRIASYGASSTYYYTTRGTPLAFVDGTLSEGCSTTTDSFPGPTNNTRYLVDLRYVVSSNRTLTLLPTNTPVFSLGQWTGNLSIAEQALGVTVEATGTGGLKGTSTVFNVGAGYYIDVTTGPGGTVTPGGRVAVNTGSNITLAVQADSGFRIDTIITNGASITGVQGRISQAVTWSAVNADGNMSVTFLEDPVSETMVAYNDLGWMDGDTSLSITTNSPAALTSGSLVDYASSQQVAAKVQMATAIGPVLIVAKAGIPLPIGSDAYNAFNGRVSCDHYSYWSQGTVTLSFSNLVSTSQYAFVLFGSRGGASEAYSNRWVDVVISDVDAYTNTSSSGIGVTRFTTSQALDSSRLIGANMEGWVVRYDGIRPGADGDITFTLLPGASPLGAGTNAYINAFMLTQTSAVSAASHTITVSFGAGGSVAPSGNVSVAHGSNAAFTVQASPYYHIQSLASNGASILSATGTAVHAMTWTNVTADGTLNATFDPNVVTNGVTELWLASYGLTNGGFETQAVLDQDGDGMPAWAEYIAGTVPTNPADCLKLREQLAAAAYTTITWQTVTGRSYTVLCAPLPGATWTNTADSTWVNRTGTGAAATFTNNAPPSTPSFYRVRVRKN